MYFGHAHGFKWRLTRQDEGLAPSAPVPGEFHVELEFLHIENALGLNELHAGRDLLGQPGTLISKGSAKGLAAAPTNIRGWPHDGVSAKELALIAHMPHGLDQLHGVQVKHVLALGIVAKDLVIAGKARGREKCPKEAAPRMSLCRSVCGFCPA